MNNLLDRVRWFSNWNGISYPEGVSLSISMSAWVCVCSPLLILRNLHVFYFFFSSIFFFIPFILWINHRKGLLKALETRPTPARTQYTIETPPRGAKGTGETLKEQTESFLINLFSNRREGGGAGWRWERVLECVIISRQFINSTFIFDQALKSRNIQWI